MTLTAERSVPLRLPVRLRDAAGVAMELGIGASTAELTVHGLRAVLEAFAQRAVLDAHYAAHPGTLRAIAEHSGLRVTVVVL